MKNGSFKFQSEKPLFEAFQAVQQKSRAFNPVRPHVVWAVGKAVWAKWLQI